MLRIVYGPGLLNIHRIYEGESNIYCLGDYYSGGTLYDHLKTSNKITENTAVNIMRQVLEALAYLQVRGLIHRDLKPENIMLANKSTSETSIEISVVDFGFMTKVSEHKILFSRCGTHGFVAPEVLADYDYDCKADIFSAGVIFYLLLLRHNPFQD